MRARYFLAALVALLLSHFWPTIDIHVRVGVAFTAKSVCSGVFVSGRSAQSVRNHELAAAGVPSFITAEVDDGRKVVRGKLAFFPFWQAIAKYHSPELGCGLVDERSEEWTDVYQKSRGERLELAASDSWKAASSGQFASEVDVERLENIVGYEFTKSAFERNHTRAVVVVYKGHILAEGYQTEHLEMDRKTRHLGWSMTKTILSLLVGIRIGQGRMSLDDKVDLMNGDNSTSSVRSLLKMADVHSVPEDYGPESFSTTSMLYTSHSLEDFLRGYAGRRKPTLGAEGWAYSSLITNLLSGALRRSFTSDTEYWNFGHKYLFHPIGAKSFVLEVDPAGNFVSSSFSYATARDWARVGQLIVQRGRYAERQVVPESYIQFMTEPFAGSGGQYGAQLWVNPIVFKPIADSAATHGAWALHNPIHLKELLPDLSERTRHELSDTARFLIGVAPADTIYLSGYDGQRVIVVPSMQLVVVRLGLTRNLDMPLSLASTPELWKPAWNKQLFLKSVLECFHQQ